MKKDKGIYEEEKRRHEEAQQRYEEDHIGEMEIISLHNRCNKKVRQPKKAPFKSDEPKKVPESREFIDDPSEEEQNSKNSTRLRAGPHFYNFCGNVILWNEKSFFEKKDHHIPFVMSVSGHQNP